MKYSIYKRAFPLILIFLTLSLVSCLYKCFVTCIILDIIAIYIAYFFRMPILKINENEDLVISPAWGKVTSIEKVDSNGNRTVSIFLSIFDVHLQTVPCHGTVKEINYTKGQFVNALKPESSECNERNSISIEYRKTGQIIKVTQIAGLIARRIFCWVKPGQKISSGEYYGLISFGSRVEVTLPDSFDIIVKPGDKVRCGVTTLAKLKLV